MSTSLRPSTRVMLGITLVAPLALLSAAPATAADDVTPPTAPSGLHVRDLSFTSVTLDWNPSTDDSGWLLYETEVSAPNDAQRYAALEPTKSYTNLLQGTTYTATVVAVDGAHNRSASVSVQFTTPVDSTPPTTPQNLRAVTHDGVLEALEWEPSTDNTNKIVYTLRTDAGPIYSTSGTRVTAQEILDRFTVAPGDTVTVTVQARDASGLLSGKSGPVTVTFPS